MVNQEVSDEEQAAAAIKLADNVRNLIRSEIKEALEDPQFWWGINRYAVESALFSNSTATNFRDAVRSVIKEQMEKY